MYVDFDPQAGHEQAGRRPALIVSASAYNEKVGLALVCPVTKQAKGYPFEVPLPATGRITGVVLSDQVKSIDWEARSIDVVEMAPPEVVARVLGMIAALLELGT